jgi:uncharacterized cupredoxin-like copper-binding protein
VEEVPMSAVRLVALLSAVAVTLSGCRQAAEEDVQAPKQAEEQPAAPQEVAITFDGTAFSMSPATIEAAPVTLTFQNDGGQPASAFITKFLPGKGPDDLAQVKSEEDFFQLIVPAGSTPEAAPGQSSRLTIQLPEGDYAVIGESGEQPGIFEVVATSREVAPPEADLQVDAGDFFFKTSESEVASGPLTIELRNVGKQGHEMVLSKKGGKEEEGVFSLAPPPGGTVWVEAELTPGIYEMVCFFPDPESGKHHIELGMQTDLTVV